MDRFFNKKRKKSPEPPQQPGVFTNIVSGPGLRVEMDIDPSDERDSRGPRIVSQDKSGGGQGLPAPGASISGVVDAATGPGNDPTSDDTGEGESTEASRIAKRARIAVLGGTAIPIDVENEAADGFRPLKAVLEAISAVYTNSEETVAIRNKIEDLLSRLAVLEARFATRPDDVSEQRRRSDIIRKLKGIEGQLRSLYRRPLLQRPADHVQDDEDVFRLLEDLQEAISDYQTVQQTAIHERGCGLIDPAEAAVLNNFRCAQAAEHRHGGREGCLKGTRRTLLDGIGHWTQDFDKPPVYWLNGLAGTGKSTESSVCEHPFRDGLGNGASFFCSRDFEDRSNLHFIFPTLAVQLARKYTEFRSIFVPLVQSDPGIIHESLYGQMEKLIVQPLVKSGISTVIVIDALDECKDEEPASAILSVLGQLVSEVPKVKFFVTGRPEPRIREGFRLPLLARATDVFILHEVESGQVNSDIQLFLSHKFLELKGQRQGLDGWPTREQLDKLCERAGGLFVYAMATVRFIRRQNSNPRKRLDLLLQSPDNTAHEGKTELKPNTTLDLLYLSILQEAFGGDDPEDDSKVRSVLGAVILTANPLSPSMIATLLDLDTGDIFPLLSSVHSLLTLRQDVNHPVRPFHKSFPDFIVDPARCTNQRFHISPPDHHLQLLIGCLELMNRRLEKNMCRLPDAVTNSEVNDLRERTEQYIDHALQYACRSWHKHLANTMPIHTPEVTSVLHQFLEEKFLFWLEVLSVLGSARDAVDALRVAIKFLQALPTLELIHDCFHFVTAFFGIINESAPHIYHSALLLSPQTSIVQKLYKLHAHPLARIVQGVPASWDPNIIVKRPFSVFTWSPCSRFIAIAWHTTWKKPKKTIEILDAMTLEPLKSFVPPNHETYSLTFSTKGHLLTWSGVGTGEVISWDVQTGVQTSAIYPGQGKSAQEPFSITHSACGMMLGVLFKDKDITSIHTYDVLSGTPKYNHPVRGSIIDMIWTHGESLRFPTLGSGSITVWEVRFASERPPMEVMTFPTPNNFDPLNEFLFLPSLSRLAFAVENTVLIWDVQHSQLLLHHANVDKPWKMSSSTDGNFFACGTCDQGVYLWKEFPTGYILHQRFIPTTSFTKPLLSPDGQSIIVSSGPMLQLWPTIGSIISPSSTPNPAFRRTRHFILGFSPDEPLAASAKWRDNTVTVCDLRSGIPQLIIDTGMEVCGLGVAGGTIVVVGDKNIVTWNLPKGDYTSGARVNTEDSIQETVFDHPRRRRIGSTSISPDLCYIAFSMAKTNVQVYDMSTGKWLEGPGQLSPGTLQWFTPDGGQIWCHHFGSVEGLAIIKDNESNPLRLENLQPSNQPEVSPWKSSQGYKVTDDGWVLSSSGKHLLSLPLHWRSLRETERVWNGQFLSLLHRGLPEAVILELLEE